jgi:uroporphyrinogen-III synthase
VGIRGTHLRPVYLISKTSYADVIHIPILTISFLTPDIDFTEYEGVIITSKQAVSALQNYSLDWNTLQCIAVSDSTAQCVREAGAKQIEIADGYGESIPNLLKAKVRSGKWLYLRPKVVASDWVETARECGIKIDEAIVYETLCNENGAHHAVANDGVLIFTSPSTIRCFLQNYSILSSHTIIVIGKTTQKALPSGISSYMSEVSSVASAVDLARQIAAEG